MPNLAHPATARAVARRFQVRRQPGLGQHFLVDDAVRRRIVDTLQLTPDLPVLEVGPGLGSLTQALLEAGAAVVAVEIDPACRAALGLLGHHFPSLRVVAGDILREEPASLGLPDRYLVVGNLPYNLTGALLPRLLTWEPAPQRCGVLIQREVAARLDADEGNWSLATLTVRLLGETHRHFDVPPGAFWPPPRVVSTFLSLVPMAVAPLGERQAVLRVARTVFQARRKQLAHGVGRAVQRPAAAVRPWLAARGFDPERRPGTLSVEEWRRLVAELSGAGWLAGPVL